MSLPLKSLNFVVDSLLSQGLHILAVSPKVGKLWLALWLSVMVAKGESVWGMSVKRGTTAISGAVDSSFTLVEEQRDSGKVKLSYIGRNIKYRELTLERNGENVWEMISDSRTQLELLGDRIVYLLSKLMCTRAEFIGTPTELSEKIDPIGVERISPKKVSPLILQNLEMFGSIGISGTVRQSNGKRLIELRRADSDGKQEPQRSTLLTL